jgi:hypothetical protein
MVKSLERSIIGRAVADFIQRHRADNGDALLNRDTADLVAELESLVSSFVNPAYTPEEDQEQIVKYTKHGDRVALGKYLKGQKDWGIFSPALRAAVAGIICGETRRSANRPPASTTRQTHIMIAIFVAKRMAQGQSYAEASEEVQTVYELRDGSPH